MIIYKKNVRIILKNYRKLHKIIFRLKKKKIYQIYFNSIKYVNSLINDGVIRKLHRSSEDQKFKWPKKLYIIVL